MSTEEINQNILFTEFQQPQEIGPTLFPLEPVVENNYNLAGQDLSQTIRRVFVYANPSKLKTAACLELLLGILKKFGIEVLVYNEYMPSRAHLIEYVAQALQIPLQVAEYREYYGEHPEEPFIGLNNQAIFDLVITVGGDGTVLKYISYSPFRDIPILPINTGSLGYITSISFPNVEESLKMIFSGAFVYSPRLMLKAQLLDAAQNPKHYRNHFALNEIAISTYRAGHMAEMELQVGGSSIPLQGDGVIAATPTGSTAYSLAAGGPIVDSEMEAMIITPVSPFSLATRPVVTSSNVHLFIRNAAVPDNATKPEDKDASMDNSVLPLSVAIDGWNLGELYAGESIYITGSEERIQFLAMSHNSSYFENIRTKLGWHGMSHKATAFFSN